MCAVHPDTGSLQVYNTSWTTCWTSCTKKLAADIQENLRTICSTEELDRIEVVNLDK